MSVSSFALLSEELGISVEANVGTAAWPRDQALADEILRMRGRIDDN